MLDTLQQALQYIFREQALLITALTHSSYAHEKGLGASECNERLEFLGDAVLELTVSEMLYRRYPELPEGELTKRRARLVCENSLAALARELDMGNCLRLGRGEELSGGRERNSLLADALEAVFGAVYLDGSMKNTQTVIHRLFDGIVDQRSITDYKTTLQEIIQKNSHEGVVYEIVGETGPSHMKEFTAVVSHLGNSLGTGAGRNKKEAEQCAAMNALSALGYNH